GCRTVYRVWSGCPRWRRRIHTPNVYELDILILSDHLAELHFPAAVAGPDVRVELLGPLAEGFHDRRIRATFLQAGNRKGFGGVGHFALRVRRAAPPATPCRLPKELEEVGPPLPAPPGPAVQLGFELFKPIFDELDAPVQPF